MPGAHSIHLHEDVWLGSRAITLDFSGAQKSWNQNGNNSIRPAPFTAGNM